MVVAAKTHRRAHVVMPQELVEEVDALVGQRRRSHFITEAVEEKLGRRRLKATLAQMNGALSAVEVPGWETPEAAAAWVRSLRQEDEGGVASSGSAV